MGVLSELIKRLFDIKTEPRINDDTNTINVAETRIVKPNDDRVEFLVINLGVNNAFILPEPGVSATRGILLTPNGGHYLCEYDKDFHLVGKDWYGCAPLGAVNVLILEVIGT